MATRRIAGITIELNADTKEFVKGIRNLDKQLNTTQNNLKDINKLLKFNPRNTTLLTQKQKNLKSAIAGTEERLKQLKSAQTDALSPEEYDKLQREIIETQDKLDNLKKEYKDFGSVTSQVIRAAGAKIKEYGASITSVGKKLSTSITAPITGLAVAANAAFNEVDEGVDTIILATGASGVALEGMQKVMEHIVTSIPTTFKTAGDAIGAVNTRFGVTGDELEKISKRFIRFAKVNNTDVVSSVNTVQKVFAAYNVDVSDSGWYLDRLTSVAQRTGVSVDELMNGVLANSAAFKRMGLGIHASTELLGVLEMSGAESSDVMSGLSKALKNATADGEPLNKALANVQNTIKNGTSATSGLQAAYDLFGKSGAVVYDLVKSGTVDFTNLNDVMWTIEGTTARTFTSILDPADRFQQSLNALKLVGADVAESVMPILSEALLKVRDVILTLKDKWDGLDESQQKNILKFIGIVAAAGPVISIVGKLVTGVGSIIGVVGKLAGALAGFMPPAGPIIASVLAAGALIAANWENIVVVWETYLKPAIDAIGEAFKDFYETHLQPIAKWLGDTFSPAWESLKDVFTGITTWISDTFSGSWEDAWNGIVGTFGTVFAQIGDLIKAPINAVIDAINWMIDKVEGGLNTIIDGINSHLKITIPSFSIGWPINKSFGGWSWGANLSRVEWGDIEKLAAGGVLGEGRQAIVGEYAPERLSVINGRAVVTPLNSPTGGARMGENNSYTFNVYAQPGQSAQEIAQEVQRIMIREHRQRSAAYAQYT